MDGIIGITITISLNLHVNFKFPLRLCFLLLLPIFISSCSSRKQERAINGYLDLSGQKVKSSKIIDLDGNWFFFWKEVPINERGEFDLSKLKNRDSISLKGGSWQEKGLPSKGFGTFYLKITLPNDSVCRQLKINRVNSAAKVFVWGFEKKGLGTFSTKEEDAWADGRPLYIDIGCGGTTYVVLMVSNYNNVNGGGLPHGAYISSLKKMTFQKDSLFVVQSSSAFLILLLACYFIFLFFNYKNKLLLYFALFSIFCILRQFFIGEVTIYSLFPNISFDLLQLSRDILLYLGTIFYMVFFSYFMSTKKLKLIVFAIAVIYSISLLFLIINQTYNSSHVSLLTPYLLGIGTIYLIYGVFSWNTDELKSYPIIVLTAILGLVYISSDLFYLQKEVNPDFLVIFIALCFLSFQVIISYNYWKNNLMKIKNLSIEVVELNETIEVGKEERTFLLSESIQQLQSKQKLVSRLVNIKNNKTEENLNGIIAELKSTKLEESRKIILKQNIEELNFEFLRKLKQKHNNLTETDIEICSLIILGFSSKEICNLRSTTMFALKSSRYRLRKKINLSPKESLREFLKSI